MVVTASAGYNASNLTTTVDASSVRTAGQSDVQNSPNSYSLYTYSQYTSALNSVPSGYGKIATGNFTMPAQNYSTTINCGFEPTKVVVFCNYDNNTTATAAYYKDSYYQKFVSGWGTATGGGTSTESLITFTSSGFTIKAKQYSANKSSIYVAIQ